MGVGRDIERNDAIEAVFRAHGSRLWRALLLATGNADVASEAVAEAFAQLIARGSAVRDPGAWVWRAAFRLAIGDMQRKRTVVTITDDLPSDAPEQLVDLDRALRRLTAHQRTAIILADYAGWSHAEIATVLRSAPATVAVHVYRARRRLRSLLEVHDD